MQLTVERGDGQPVFVDPNSSDGPQKRAKLLIVVDGYSGAGRPVALAAGHAA